MLIPQTNTLIGSAIGGAAYAAGGPTIAKITGGALPALANNGLAVVASNFLGNLVLKNPAVGAGAIGAFTADALRSSGLLSTLGLSDYISDYIQDPGAVALPVGHGAVYIGTGARGMHDIGRGRVHHRRHHMSDEGAYQAYESF